MFYWPLLGSTFHLGCRQPLVKMDSHCKPKFSTSLFLGHLRLQHIALFLVKAVKRSEGQGLFTHDSLQAHAPVLQHAGSHLCWSTRWCPEDLRGQNLEATVVQDAILKNIKVNQYFVQVHPVGASWCSTCIGHRVTFMSPLMPFELNINSWDPVVKDRIAFLPCVWRRV